MTNILFQTFANDPHLSLTKCLGRVTLFIRIVETIPHRRRKLLATMHDRSRTCVFFVCSTIVVTTSIVSLDCFVRRRCVSFRTIFRFIEVLYHFVLRVFVKKIVVSFRLFWRRASRWKPTWATTAWARHLYKWWARILLIESNNRNKNNLDWHKIANSTQNNNKNTQRQ